MPRPKRLIKYAALAPTLLRVIDKTIEDGVFIVSCTSHKEARNFQLDYYGYINALAIHGESSAPDAMEKQELALKASAIGSSVIINSGSFAVQFIDKTKQTSYQGEANGS